MLKKRKGYNITEQYGTYFLTMTAVGWLDIFTRKECKRIIIDSLKYCQKNKGLIIHAWVLMESHLHIVASAKRDSEGLSAIIRDFKKFTSYKVLNWIIHSGRESRKEWMEIVLRYHAKYNKNNQNFKLWQSSNRPKVMLHPRFSYQKIEYIHNNPVVSEIVDKPEDYLYSSARNYMLRKDYLIEVEVLDFGVLEGFVLTERFGIFVRSRRRSDSGVSSAHPHFENFIYGHGVKDGAEYKL